MQPRFYTVLLYCSGPSSLHSIMHVTNFLVVPCILFFLYTRNLYKLVVFGDASRPCAELLINTVRFTICLDLEKIDKKAQFQEKIPETIKKRSKRQTEKVNEAFLMFPCNADPQCNIQKQLTLKIDSTLHTLQYSTARTDKKENQIFLIYEEIQSGAVAKSGRAS